MIYFIPYTNRFEVPENVADVRELIDAGGIRQQPTMSLGAGRAPGPSWQVGRFGLVLDGDTWTRGNALAAAQQWGVGLVELDVDFTELADLLPVA